MEDILERIHEANSQQVGTGSRWRIFWRGYMRPIVNSCGHRPPVEDILERIHEANSQQVGTGLRWRILWRGYMRQIVNRWAQASGGGYF